MIGQNSADITNMDSENYTFISPTTLEMVFPEERSTLDNVIREHPSGLLRERSPEEIVQLRNHPFFALRFRLRFRVVLAWMFLLGSHYFAPSSL